MCMICLDLDKNKLSFGSAVRNLFELQQNLSNDHVIRILEKISEIEPENIDEATNKLLKEVESKI